jgi:hypothetical protein
VVNSEDDTAGKGNGVREELMGLCIYYFEERRGEKSPESRLKTGLGLVRRRHWNKHGTRDRGARRCNLACLSRALG